MAFNSLLRRASSTVLPLAIRAVGSSRTYHRAISTVEKSSLRRQLNRHAFAPFVRFSTAIATKPSSDESLISIIQNEIDGADQPNKNILEDKPEDFLFEIDDSPGERSVLLTREYGYEIIKVNVEMPNVTGEEEDLSMPLVVSITKGNGLCLEFGVTAFLDEITIDSLSIKQSEDSEDELAYEGPDFDDLDPELQKALHEFLEVRGINADTARFLQEYMNNKDAKEYLAWLKNLKKFVKK